MPRPSLVIFDLDGTLIDSAGDICRALNALLSDLGCPPLPLVEVRDLIGDGAASLVQRGLAAHGRASKDIKADLQRFVEHYTAVPVATTELYPGVKETLQLLSERDYTLTVCTNKPIQLSETILDSLDIGRYFSAVLGGDSLPFRKPDPRILQTLLQGFSAQPSQAVLVGDSEIDAAAARAAGVPFVLVTYGYHRTPLETIPRDLTIDRFEQLTELLENA